MIVAIVVFAVLLFQPATKGQSPDGPKTVARVGLSGMSGHFMVLEPDSGFRGESETPHAYKVAGASLALSRQVTRSASISVRASTFQGHDAAPRSHSLSKSFQIFDPPPPPYDTARRDDIAGYTVGAGVDLRYLGAYAGITHGSWFYTHQYPIRDTSTPPRHVLPTVELRIGPGRGWQIEAALNSHEPATAPGPTIKAGVAYLNQPGWAALRLGLSDEGAYFGLRKIVLKEYELEPYVSIGSSSMRQMALTLRRRIAL
jgi:hypothetical protein